MTARGVSSLLEGRVLGKIATRRKTKWHRDIMIQGDHTAASLKIAVLTVPGLCEGGINIK